MQVSIASVSQARAAGPRLLEYICHPPYTPSLYNCTWVSINVPSPDTHCLVFVWISSPSNSATLHICLLAPKELLLYSHDSSRVYLPPSIYTQSTYHIYISTYMYINILSRLCMHSTNMLWPRFMWISSMSATLNITHGTHIVFSVALSSGFSDGVILPTSKYAMCYTIS